MRYSDLFFTGSDDGNIRGWSTAAATTSGSDSSLQEIVKIPVSGVINALHVTESGTHLFGLVGEHHRLGQ